MLNGKKIAVPKKFLHNDYLQTAEDAPEPVQVPEKAQQDPVDLLQNEPLSRDALESIKSDLQTSFDASGRLFVFPQNCPGFEVVHPQIESMTASVNFEVRFNIFNVCTPILFDVRFLGKSTNIF